MEEGTRIPLSEYRKDLLAQNEMLPEVQKLRQKVNKYKPFFSDMVSKDNPLDYDDILLIVKNWSPHHEAGFNHIMFSIEMDEYTVKHRPDIALLHELIHLHIFRMEEAEMDHCQEQLQKSLADQIPDLDYILEDTNDYIIRTVPQPAHNRLFFLKSLDIDLKKPYKLGTTFDYGMNRFIRRLPGATDNS